MTAATATTMPAEQQQWLQLATMSVVAVVVVVGQAGSLGRPCNVAMLQDNIAGNDRVNKHHHEVALLSFIATATNCNSELGLVAPNNIPTRQSKMWIN